jgi:hypothetical protein
MTPYAQRSCEYFRMKHVTANKLAWGNVKNKITDFTIIEYFSLPNHPPPCPRILQQYRDTPESGHCGQA